MFGNLKKLLGGSLKLRNPAGLGAAQIKTLSEDLAGLQSLASDVPRRVLRYVVDGKDDAVLSVLRNSEAANALSLRATDRQPWLSRTPPRDTLFRTADRPPAEFWLRLARVWDAAAAGKVQKVHLAGLPEMPSWFEVFLWEATQAPPNVYGTIDPNCFRVALLEQMLALDDRPPQLLFRAALFVDPKDMWTGRLLANRLVQLTDFGERVSSAPDLIRAALGQKDAARRLYVLDTLSERHARVAPLLGRLVELATGPAKTIRRAAEKLLRTERDRAVPLLEQTARDGSLNERRYAVEILHRCDPAGNRKFLEERLGCEPSEKLKVVLKQLLSMAMVSTAAGDKRIQLPPTPPVNPAAPLPHETRTALRQLFERCNRLAHEYCAQKRKEGRHYDWLHTTSIGRTEADRAFEFLQEPELGCLAPQDAALGEFVWEPCQGLIGAFLERAELKPIHAIRLLLLIGDCRPNDESGGGWFTHSFHGYWRAYLRAHALPVGLRELAAVLEAVGIGGHAIGRELLQPYGYSFEANLEQVWHYFAEHIDLLEGIFGLRAALFEVPRFWIDHVRQRALSILGLFPAPPASLQPVLWQIALEGTKVERPLAQKCLQSVPDRDARIVKALASGSRGIRAVAAEWLGALRAAAAADSLRTALRKEKHDGTQAALLSALEALGAPVDEFVGRDGLVEKSKIVLEEGVPTELTWLPFDRLPAVHWADTNEPVAPDIIRGLLVQCCQFRSPEPGPMLRRHVSYFRREDAERLGQFILDAWIGHDTVPMPANQADQKAKAQATAMASYLKKPVAQLYGELYRQYLQTPGGSAIRSKGILAIAGAASTGQAVRRVEQYLRTWYGLRAAQCKALIAMLAWIDDPAAIQLLLSVSTRFRTAGIRKEADKHVNLLAARKNWTRDELADRTIPTCGFDERCELTLEFGERVFTARLDADCGLILAAAEGTRIKSLPAPRKSEDEVQVKAAQARLSTARKQLKSMLRLQKERMYEAMCTQRRWLFSDWNMYLNHHPIVRRYCQRLVWAVAEGGGVARTFHPLDDGTLTDAEDEPMTVELDAVVTIAHDSLVAADVGRKWLAHLADFELSPLFIQFGKSSFTLPEGRHADTAIEEFLGYMVEAFALRNLATRLGYTRGQAEDGGWFYAYCKRFPSLRLEAIIEFTGNGLPEENLPVALKQLCFERLCDEAQETRLGGRHGADRCTLGSVPPVLLAECWNDLRTIAVAGSGYDPNWEKRVGF